MYSVYLLQSLRNKEKTYVGLTIKPLKNRLEEHNVGLTKSTKYDKPWEVIYYEQFYCKICADKREQFLKSGFGYRFRKLLLRHKDELKLHSTK